MKEKIISRLLAFMTLTPISAGYEQAVIVKDIDINGNTLQISINKDENIEFYTIDCENNPFFLGEKSVVCEENNAEINISPADVMYIKLDAYYKDGHKAYSGAYTIKQHEHTYNAERETLIPQKCKAEGAKIYKCTDCSAQHSITLDALGCNSSPVGYQAATCTKEGYTTWRCERCGEAEKVVHPKLEHIFVYTETIKDATCTANGVDQHNCVACNETKLIETPLKEHSYVFAGEYANNNTVGTYSKCKTCGKKITATVFARQNISEYTGMLHIPAVGVTIPVYGGGQDVVDAENSASRQPWGDKRGKILIGDHNYQGFNKIKKCIPGSTIAYYAGNKYICTESFDGINTRIDLQRLNGASLANESGAMYLITCNDWEGTSVRIVSFNLA